MWAYLIRRPGPCLGLDQATVWTLGLARLVGGAKQQRARLAVSKIRTDSRRADQNRRDIKRDTLLPRSIGALGTTSTEQVKKNGDMSPKHPDSRASPHETFCYSGTHEWRKQKDSANQLDCTWRLSTVAAGKGAITS